MERSDAREKRTTAAPLRVTQVGIAGLVLFLGYVLLASPVLLKQGGAVILVAIGRLVLFLSLAAMLGWAAYRLGRRSTKAGNWVFSGILALPWLALPWDMAVIGQRERAWSRFEKDRLHCGPVWSRSTTAN